MKIFLMRHAVAMEREDFAKKNKDDSLRPLIEKGRERTRKMTKQLQLMDENFDMIISSPFLRAMQTAEIVCQGYNIRELHECAELVPSAPPQALAQWLRTEAKRARSLLAVGHEPQMSVFASWLVSGYTDSVIELKKAGVICLEVESFEDLGPRSALLKWILQPKNLLI